MSILILSEIWKFSLNFLNETDKRKIRKLVAKEIEPVFD